MDCLLVDMMRADMNITSATYIFSNDEVRTWMANNWIAKRRYNDIDFELYSGSECRSDSDSNSDLYSDSDSGTLNGSQCSNSSKNSRKSWTSRWLSRRSAS